MANTILKAARNDRRKKSIRKKIYGTQERPRLSVTKSNDHIYAQVIDDDKKVTLCSASTIDKEIKGLIKPEMTKVEKSKVVGLALAKRAVAANVTTIAFDRNGNVYKGRIKALADAIREGGLNF